MKARVSFPSMILVPGLAACIQGILRPGKDRTGGLGVHCEQPDVSMRDSYSQKGRVKTGNGTPKQEDDDSSMPDPQSCDSPSINTEPPPNEITCNHLEA